MKGKSRRRIKITKGKKVQRRKVYTERNDNDKLHKLKNHHHYHHMALQPNSGPASAFGVS
jgi:hypothetical protein